VPTSFLRYFGKRENAVQLNQLEENQSKDRSRRIRYRVVLQAKAGNNIITWQTHLNANSPKEALMTAQQLFRKDRGEIQSTVMSQWELRDVTPIKTIQSV
jgi:hypothetical protein